jgi:hypothetical protein
MQVCVCQQILVERFNKADYVIVHLQPLVHGNGKVWLIHSQVQSDLEDEI